MKLLPEIGETVKRWRESLPSAAPGNLARLGSSRELTGASLERQAPVRPDLIEDDTADLHGIMPGSVRAGVAKI